MKIVNVMLGRGLGGIEQAAVDYSEALKLAGHDVHAVVHPHAQIIDTLKKQKIPYVTLANRGAWDLISVVRLRRMLNAMKIDVCIAHGNRAISLLKYATGKKRKLVAVTHNYKIKCGKVKYVFCPTHDLIRYAQRKGISRNRIHYIPNMVRMAHEPKQHNRHQPPVIGSIGRFVAKKGFDLFIETLRALRTRNLQFRAIIAGSGEEEGTLKRLVIRKGLQDIVSFPGWVEDKQAFYDSIDIFCLPSHHEPFGIVLIEAMAQGLPVISTASEGPSEIIDNGINGLLVDKNDVIQLADGLQHLLNEPVTAQNLGKNAFETVYNHYDISVVSVKLDLALKSL